VLAALVLVGAVLLFSDAGSAYLDELNRGLRSFAHWVRGLLP
jgi:hypothetical protein